MKAAARTPKVMTRPITLPLCQGYFVPAQEKARKRQVSAETSIKLLITSNCKNFSLKVRRATSLAFHRL
jgi:hypothetical protein